MRDGDDQQATKRKMAGNGATRWQFGVPPSGGPVKMLVHRGLELTPFLVRASCDLSGFFQLGRKFARRQVSER